MNITRTPFIVLFALLPVATDFNRLMAQPAGSEARKVELSIEKAENHHEIYLNNKNPYFVTVKLRVSGTNIRTSKTTPFTLVLPRRSKDRVLYIFPREQGKSYKFHTDYTWFMGKVDARHNDRYIYRLPFPRGAPYLLIQGFDGTYSHGGNARYALDFKMPVGTPIHAARDGVVVKVIEKYQEGGTADRFRDRANMVVIEHRDGTFGEYAHIQHRGALVKVGEQVDRGRRIALSGNTGYSTGPHLHFMVTKVLKDGSTTSLPFAFRAERGVVRDPEEGEKYRAR